MKIGNLPQSGELVRGDRRYWRLAIGRYALGNRYMDNGWYGFEFVVLKKHAIRDSDRGAHLPHAFRIAFAYWLPFYSL